jgi:L-ascorbate metabolism protein UlaG (beta-lactamase superfamily)
LLRWKLFSHNRFEDALEDQQVTPVDLDWSVLEGRRGLSLTFLKHACVIIRDLDETIIVDPVFGEIFPFIKDFSPLAFSPKRLPAVDRILITHGHYDHLDKNTLSRFPASTQVISPLGYDGVFRELKMTRRTQLDWYRTFDDGRRRITLLPAHHWTMRNPIAGPNRSLWGSYIIETAAGPTIYLSGDTAYFDGFEQIGAEWDIDLAVFNLGAYEPRWFMAPSHIDPAETVRAFQELGAQRLAIVHWGTFRLGDEPVHLPPRHLEGQLAAKGLRNRWLPLVHGETWLA